MPNLNNFFSFRICKKNLIFDTYCTYFCNFSDLVITNKQFRFELFKTSLCYYHFKFENDAYDYYL